MGKSNIKIRVITEKPKPPVRPELKDYDYKVIEHGVEKVGRCSKFDKDYKKFLEEERQYKQDLESYKQYKLIRLIKNAKPEYILKKYKIVEINKTA